MTLPPLKDVTLEARYSFGGDQGSGSISITTYGGGAFLELITEDPLRLDADEIMELAIWVQGAVKELDEFNGEIDLKTP